jgi:hypothetical protein
VHKRGSLCNPVDSAEKFIALCNTGSNKGVPILFSANHLKVCQPRPQPILSDDDSQGVMGKGCWQLSATKQGTIPVV